MCRPFSIRSESATGKAFEVNLLPNSTTRTLLPTCRQKFHHQQTTFWQTLPHLDISGRIMENELRPVRIEAPEAEAEVYPPKLGGDISQGCIMYRWQTDRQSHKHTDTSTDNKGRLLKLSSRRQPREPIPLQIPATPWNGNFRSLSASCDPSFIKQL